MTSSGLLRRYKKWNGKRWIVINSNSEYHYEEPDSLIYLLKRIRDSVGGKICEIGDMQYKICNDRLDLAYQWDECFGITIIYPNQVSSEIVIEFLEKYMY